MPGVKLPRSVFTGDYKTFLRLLVQARKDSGLRQHELAAILEVDQGTISKIERGVRRLDVVEFVGIAAALGVDPLDFLARYLKARTNEDPSA